LLTNCFRHLRVFVFVSVDANNTDRVQVQRRASLSSIVSRHSALFTDARGRGGEEARAYCPHDGRSHVFFFSLVRPIIVFRLSSHLSTDGMYLTCSTTILQWRAIKCDGHFGAFERLSCD